MGTLFLSPILEEKLLAFHVKYVFSRGLVVSDLYDVACIPSTCILLSVFIYERGLNFVKHFFASIEISIRFSSFILLCGVSELLICVC